jgi:hypothetical protein
MSKQIDWANGEPPDKEKWEAAAIACAGAIERAGRIRIRKVSDTVWLIEGARKSVDPESPKDLDFRRQLTEALQERGKEVLGLGALHEPLTPAREEAIRSSVQAALHETYAHPNGTLFDVQVVADLLDEVDRLRAKLQLAAQARDLAGQAGSKLRDACEDITPRPTRATRRTDPNP